MIKIENHFSFYENKVRESDARDLSQLKTEYESKDWEILHSSWRKNQGYIPHGTRKRTITTVFGDLTYRRHRYKYWDKWRYRFVYLSDLELGIEKYQRTTNHIKIKIIEKIAQGKRYRDILDCFSAVNITKRTVSNIISRAKINSFAEALSNTTLEKVKIEKCLYINIDDTFLPLKEHGKNKKARVRAVLMHTGYDFKKSTRTKKVLKNVRFYGFLLQQNKGIETQKFMNKVYELANQFYSNVDDVKVIISGDGAPWIRQCSSYWPGSIYTLDKFHAFRSIRRVFNTRDVFMNGIYQKATHLFSDGNYLDLMRLLNEKWFEDPIKTKKLTELKNYFKMNEKEAHGLTNQSDKYNIGCNIESAISHNVKWLLGYGAKAFSKKVFSKILDIHMATVNGISIIDLFKEKIAKEEKKKQVFFRQSFWINQNKQRYNWLPSCRGSQ